MSDRKTSGAPVYLVRSHGSNCWEEISGESLEMCQAQPGEYEVRKLYAEQPAPTPITGDDVLRWANEHAKTLRKIKPVISGWQLDSYDDTLDGVDPEDTSSLSNHSVAQLVSAVRTLQARQLSEQPAPVAVVLPERKPEPSCMTQIDDDREASIWNACLDEVTRLNTK